MTAIYNTLSDHNLIYIYSIDDENHKGILKIGKASLTTKNNPLKIADNSPELNVAADARIQEQTRTAKIENYSLLHTEIALRIIHYADDNTDIPMPFLDTDVHEVLRNSGYVSIKFRVSGKDSEWFKVDLDTAKEAIKCFKRGLTQLPTKDNKEEKEFTPSIKLRDEQSLNVDKTIKVFEGSEYDSMLWNCKMRYGKTVTAYSLIKRMLEIGKFKKVIVITHRPAVIDGWDTDHSLIFSKNEHTFVDKSNGKDTFDDAIDAKNDLILNSLVSENKPFIYFASIQDLRGSARVKIGGYNKNNAVFDMPWDLIIIDEAHEGTQTDLGDAVVKALTKENTKLLFLSGTPYNIIEGFTEENTFNWSYLDEQKAKRDWEINHPNEKNPYYELPKMNIFTFDISDALEHSYRYSTEDAAFNFREFFRTWTGDKARDFREIPEGKNIGDFVHEEDVNAFLDLITEESPNSNYPFARQDFREMFSHTFWIVPGVKEAKALSALLQKHKVFSDYKIANIAGEGDEEQPYDQALALVKSCIKYYPKTITISCGKLTTGVTVKEWTGVMMLSGSSSTSASGYMQTIFRAQSPAIIDGRQKVNCYVFDFAPDRTLKVISEVHNLTRKGTSSDEDSKAELGEFINFCPVISIKGTEMHEYDVPEMMRQIKKISVDSAIKSGFDDDTIYKTDVGFSVSDEDAQILNKLLNVLSPQKRSPSQKDVIVASNGLTEEQKRKLKGAKRKPKKELTPEEKEALEAEKKRKEAQAKIFSYLRAVSIRLPLLFYGAEADITKHIQLKDFAKTVDDESWAEYMPEDLSKDLFIQLIRFYDEDVVVGAGLRIRKLAKAADELMPSMRVIRLLEIISRFKNPDKETVLTPWRVVCMHMTRAFGGFTFYNKDFSQLLERPEFIDHGKITNEIYNKESKLLEINSKSGLYPLYLAYTLYLKQIDFDETKYNFNEAWNIWNNIVLKNIFVLCKTKMAKQISIRTLVGYSGKQVNAIYLTKLVEERMSDLPRLTKKILNPNTWNLANDGQKMKFNAVVGNPPYQGKNHRQIYPDFYLTSITLADYVSLIFPIGWQAPKSGNNLDKLNKEEIKTDKRIKFIDNRENVFPGIAGAQWINIILWEKALDNKQQGLQLIYTNGENPTLKKLEWDASNIAKPIEITELAKLVVNNEQHIFSKIKVSSRKPYGLPTDITKYPEKYNLKEEKEADTDIKIYANKKEFWVNSNYKFPKKSESLSKYKVLIPYAWGNMDEKSGLGGAFADVIIAAPNEACNETYLESGMFDEYDKAQKHAKYLMTKFLRALLYLNKTSQHSTTAWGAVPEQDYSEEWWNKPVSELEQYLFEKYNIPQNIRDFVINNFQTKDEKNIANYK